MYLTSASSPKGNQQDYGMRIYDTILGRFLSVDPISKQYPELTPYQFASNRPFDGIDLDGLEFFIANTTLLGTSATLSVPKTTPFLDLLRPIGEIVKPMEIAKVQPGTGVPIPPCLPPLVIPNTATTSIPPMNVPIDFAYPREAIPDATATTDLSQNRILEARRMEPTEAEQDIVNEDQKIEAMGKRSKNGGKTKKNTEKMEKESGHQFEEIQKAQNRNPKKIENTDKSEQRDYVENNRMGQESLEQKLIWSK